MEPSAAVLPAGPAEGHKPQSGDHKALTFGPSSMLREGPKVQGGRSSPKGHSPREVHSPKDPKGREEAVLPSLNPKPKTQSARPETHFVSWACFRFRGISLLKRLFVKAKDSLGKLNKPKKKQKNQLKQ